ncbi:acyltransferase [bacterium]|nr:acyltransferase [bacterium]
MTMNLDVLDKVKGHENRIVFYSDSEKFDELTEEEIELLDSFDLIVDGTNNVIKVKIKERRDIETFLRRDGLFISVVGHNNTIDLASIGYCVNPQLNITGLQIYIGGAADGFINPELPRYASNCNVSIGDGTVFCGTRIYLQDDNSSVTIGKNCMFSWGIDVWCTDVHTILDLDGNITNYGKSIEIQDHVWVGKDSKIGKNTKISKDSIVGWNSVVTKKFDETNVVIAGNPAKIVKNGINWDARDIQNYKLYKGL